MHLMWKSPSHPKNKCPAREATCHKCKKKGHFQTVCRSARDVDTVEEDLDQFLGVVHANDKQGWNVTLELNGKPCLFKIDTGADVTVINEKSYRELMGPHTLPPSSCILRGPNSQPLEVMGRIVGTLCYQNRKSTQEIFVIKNLAKPLLGRPAIEQLQLISRVDSVENGNKDALWIRSHPKLFQGLGKLSVPYKIRLRDGAKPFILTTPRRVAIPLLPKVKEELQRMENLGVISKVTGPSEWCTGMVVVPKTNGKVHICVDLTKLNQNVCRERHILPSVEQTLAQLGTATVFSKLDANSGFWQVKLDEESALLTTFITPFGRYCFNRMPFGITSAPEHFQRRMSEALVGLEGVVCMMDDILVHGKSESEHDRRLTEVLRRLETVGLTLNREKCEFSKRQISFLGQTIDEKGVRPDPSKVKAVQELPTPTNVRELRRVLGMVNQFRKFSPRLADKLKPLCELLSTKNQWLWERVHQEAFQSIKEEMSSSHTLALYNPSLETCVSADASSFGLGAVLQQKHTTGEWKPVGFISRIMTETEQHYAQIEKEALAVTWACERFGDYLTGLHFKIETDHKPLVPLLSEKSLDEVPIRVQRFRLRLMRFNFTVEHVPGKELITADTLSRAPLPVDGSRECLEQEVQVFVDQLISELPVSGNGLQRIRQHQDADEVCHHLIELCLNGEKSRNCLKGIAKSYAPVAYELSVEEGLLLRGRRIVIPNSLRAEMLEKLHQGHQGVTKCKQRARHSIWWPGISKDIENRVQKCLTCLKFHKQQAEPLISTPFPDYPWQRVGTDLFEWKKVTYLLIIDYYSRFIEMAKLTRLSSKEVICHIKSIFSRHGIPEVVISDNGPQFAAEEFALFAHEYNFTHITSSPRYPQSNGAAERGVKTLKQMLDKSEDPYDGLLAYRSTPLENGYSPAELLMGRKLRTKLPILPSDLCPSLPDNSKLTDSERKLRERQKRNFDDRHKARVLRSLHPGDTVWLPEFESTGKVAEEVAPRSYVVETAEGGSYRRNRRHLVPIPEKEAVEKEIEGSSGTDVEQSISNQESIQEEPDMDSVRTRSGRLSKAPLRYSPQQ